MAIPYSGSQYAPQYAMHAVPVAPGGPPGNAYIMPMHSAAPISHGAVVASGAPMMAIPVGEAMASSPYVPVSNADAPPAYGTIDSFHQVIVSE